MRRRRLDRYEVVTADRGVDALIVERPGLDPMLVLRPGITYEAAVSAVQAIAPFASAREIGAVVRRHLPDAPDLASVFEDPDALEPPDARPHLLLVLLGSVASALLLTASVLTVHTASMREEIEKAHAATRDLRAATDAHEQRVAEQRAQIRSLRADLARAQRVSGSGGRVCERARMPHRCERRRAREAAEPARS